jgi:hypothetical protein
MLREMPEGEEPLGESRRRWVDKIKMDLGEREYGLLWTGLVCFRIGTCGGIYDMEINFWFP